MDNPGKLQDGYKDKKVTCPHCGSKNCFESLEEATDVTSWLCLSCGYTTNTFFTEESQHLESSFKTAPTLIKELQFIDLLLHTKGWSFTDTHKTEELPSASSAAGTEVHIYNINKLSAEEEREE